MPLKKDQGRIMSSDKVLMEFHVILEDLPFDVPEERRDITQRTNRQWIKRRLGAMSPNSKGRRAATLINRVAKGSHL